MGSTAENVRANIKRLRMAQGLSTVTCSTRLSGVGVSIPATGLTRIEKAQRSVTVDELTAFASIFGVKAASLLEPFECPTCHGKPPTGFTCQLCGAPDLPQHDNSLEARLLSFHSPDHNITDEFLKELSEIYLELVAANINPSPAIADQTEAPVGTVRRWVAVARKRGFLPPGTQGRAG